jgi:hypothetical protein
MSTFTNKTAGITGGNSGIDLANSQELRRQTTMDEPHPTSATEGTNPFLSGNFAPVPYPSVIMQRKSLVRVCCALPEPA